MKVAIIAKLRNGPLVQFRRDMGISQAKAAKMCGVAHQTWNQIECMHFDNRCGVVTIRKIAELIGCNPEEILPAELRGVKLGSGASLERVEFREVPSRVLAQASCNTLMIEDSTAIIKRAMHKLNDRERTVLTLRFGLDGDQPKTLEDTAKAVGVTRERVRQVEAKAMNKVRKLIPLDEVVFCEDEAV